MSISKFAVFGAALVSLSVLGEGARAQSPEEKASLQENCSGDYLRLCGQYSPDGPEVDQCFKEKAKQLTPQCSAAIAAYKKKNPHGRKH